MNTEQDIAKRTLSLLDLTSLNDDDTDSTIELLCEKADSDFGHVAAVCVWPRFVKLASTRLAGSDINIAAVANFPEGLPNIENAVATCHEIIQAGGDEVDVVMPYNAYLQGNSKIAAELISACKSACANDARLKVIIETGVLETAEAIKGASLLALDNGADFIKTSTGKVPIAATPVAAKIMLQTLKNHTAVATAGFKAAGGIKDVASAKVYLDLADEIMGSSWVSPQTFRFGASGVLTSLLDVLNGRKTHSITTGY